MLEKNMGTLDRIIRLILALAVIFVSLYFELYELIILALLLIFTVVTSFCGFYKLFGLKTCPNELTKNDK